MNHRLTTLLCLALCGAVHAAEPDEAMTDTEGEDALPQVATGKGSLAAEAQRQLAALKESTYLHHVSVDEAAGRFDYDCSGFVGYALAHVDAAALKEVRDAPGKRPLAKHFEAFFRGLSPLGSARWLPVRTAEALAAGDVLAWKRPAEMASTNTGHVMVVSGPAVKLREGEWVVPVVDSTGKPHGAGDSRWGRATGLGTGRVVLLVDAQGRPEGFRWTVKSHRRWLTDVAMGRLKGP